MGVSNLDVIDDNQIPVIKLHNNPDCVVPYGSAPVMNCLGCSAFYWASGSNAIQARLSLNDVCTQRHARSEVLPDHCTYYTQPLLRKASCFLKGILCDNCTPLRIQTTTLVYQIVAMVEWWKYYSKKNQLGRSLEVED